MKEVRVKRLKKVVFLLVVLFGILTSAVLSAKEQAEDVVYLKNGSIIRGQIIEIIPEMGVKIETSGGSIFVYQFEEIEKIEERKGIDTQKKRKIQRLFE